MGEVIPKSVPEVVSTKFEQQLRAMNEALLVASVRQHELAELSVVREQALRISEDRYRTLFELGPVAIYSCDAAGRIEDSNKTAVDLWGRRPEFGETDERFAGTFEMYLADGTLVPHDESPMAAVLSGKIPEVCDMEVQFERPDGERVVVIANIRPLKNELGEITGAINCFVDITERKRIEVELEQTRAEAEAANRSKDVFLATLSHELRTPLTAILGWSDILMQPGCTAADLTEGLAVIERNARAQANLIEDVLDISRIVSGNLSMDIQPCQLVAIIEAAIEVVRSAAAGKSITIRADLDPTVGHVSCDSARMQQVFWNLLVNAIKFTPMGGVITIAMQRDNSAASIVVSDNGQGIRAEFMPHIFERFSQADGTSTRRVGGLGLGLSIVKHIMELHGGSVVAQSEGADRGTTITVRLPIRAVAANEASGQEVGGTGSSRSPLIESKGKVQARAIRLDGVRLLIVDDEDDARRLIAKVLRDAGAIVTVASSVREALAALAKEVPQVLISDVAMPEQDGFDLIREVRRLGHSVQQLPAVALTAFTMKGDARSALLDEFQIYVAKPVEARDLLAVVANLVGLKPGPDAN